MADKPTVDFNLDTYKATPGDPFGVVIKGKRYELPHLDDLDGWAVIDAFTRGEVTATKELLALAFGENFDAFVGSGITKKGLDEFIRRYLRHCGVELGNSGS